MVKTIYMLFFSLICRLGTILRVTKIQKPRVLFADQDKSFLDDLGSNSAQVELVSSQTMKQAQLAITDTKSRFSAICLNVNICEPHAIPLVRFVKAYRPASPLYLISDTAPGPLQREELDSLHVQGIFEKPIKPQALFERIIPGSYFNLADTLKVGQAEEIQAGDDKVAADETMHSIDAQAFLCGQKSFFDVYVRIAKGKYVMIVKAGDLFEPERVAAYIKKGVSEFYIRKEAQLYYLQYCDKITEAILLNEKVAPQVKVKQVMNLGNETYGYLKAAGISETTLGVAQSFVKQANYLVKSTGLGKISEVQSFLNNIDLADHGASCVMITSMVVKSMGFTDEKVTGLISLGAFLHDVGMLGLSETIRAKELSGEEFTEEERMQYETHPQLGADILTKIPHINALVPQIALQHHERRTRRGFPNKLGSGTISNAAEMVGLADAFLTLLRADGGVRTPLEIIKKDYGDSFSLKVLDAFLKAFQG